MSTDASCQLDFRKWHEPDLRCCPQFGRYQGESGRDADRPIRSRMIPNGPNSARAAVLACGISQQLTEENMRTLRMAFVGGFAGPLMAGNVAMLHAAPLPTNVASMKSRGADSSIQLRWGRLARRGGYKCAACLEGG